MEATSLVFTRFQSESSFASVRFNSAAAATVESVGAMSALCRFSSKEEKPLFRLVRLGLRVSIEPPGSPGGSIDTRNPNLTSLNNGFSSLLENLQSADMAPTDSTVAAAAELKRTLAKLLSDWNQVKTRDVASLNEQLR